MNTDQLIAALASGVEPVDPTALRRRLGIAALLGIVAALPLMLALLGINPGLAQAAQLPMFWVKWILMMLPTCYVKLGKSVHKHS